MQILFETQPLLLLFVCACFLRTLKTLFFKQVHNLKLAGTNFSYSRSIVCIKDNISPPKCTLVGINFSVLGSPC